MTDCIFCRIGAKQIPTETIYEDGGTFAVLDIHPRAIGHTMIMPKAHYGTILEVPDAELGGIFSAVKKVTEALRRALSPDGFTIGINHGTASGQTVDHLHIHVIPRFHNDGGGSIHSVVDAPPSEQLSEVAKRIRNEVQ